jgi:CheY-like chemotaxis protein
MKKILYAEDNAGMRKMVSHFLEATGFNVVACEDGDEAIELAEQDLFDLIILDVTMERVDGTLAAKRLRALANAHAKIPILGLTARSEQHEVLACLDSGMDIVLHKPVDLEELVNTIMNVNHVEIDYSKNGNDIDKEPLIIDVAVLMNYRDNAGNEAVSGVLRDFSKQWPIKIAELLLSLTIRHTDSFIRATEELAAIAAAIGAGKLLKYSSLASAAVDDDERSKILLSIINSCKEVQEIIDKLNDDYFFLAA